MYISIHVHYMHVCVCVCIGQATGVYRTRDRPAGVKTNSQPGLRTAGGVM